MYITTDDLINFTKKYIDEDDENQMGMLQNYCLAAEEAIAKYLGYTPEKKNYTTVLRGDNGGMLSLEALPVVSITSYKVDGESHSTDELRVVSNTQNYIRKKDCSCFCKDVEYEIQYSAGFETIPQLIKLTGLQIASLFMESSGGNLAVSSTSFADAGTRVFNNFTMDRFLNQIQEYKIGLK